MPTLNLCETVSQSSMGGQSCAAAAFWILSPCSSVPVENTAGLAPFILCQR